MKDPKDKADFLVAQFCKHSRADDTTSPKESAKQCALIAVNEIIIQLHCLRKPEYTIFVRSRKAPAGYEETNGYDEIDYWREVENHIKTL